ncbi:MAG: carboxypeptidase-like regulatory domain-containing protein, partial [Ekhidna sp.]
MKQLIILLSLSLTLNVSAKYVNGTVTDEGGQSLPGVNVVIKGTTSGVITDINGFYSIEVPSEKSILVFSYIGFESQEQKVGKRKVVDVVLISAVEGELQEVVVAGVSKPRFFKGGKRAAVSRSKSYTTGYVQDQYANYNTEEYSTIHENGFKKVLDEALSTFSIDV